MENRIEAARKTPVCVCGALGRRVKCCVGIWACNVPVQGHQASGARRESEPGICRLGSLFARWRKSARYRSNCARQTAKTEGANPSVASLDTCASAMCPSGKTSHRLFGPEVSPCGSTRLRGARCESKPGLSRPESSSLAGRTRKTIPSLNQKMIPTPTVPTCRQPRWTFGSAMSPSGNTSPRLIGLVVSLSRTPGLKSTTRFRTNGLSPRVLIALYGIVGRKLY